MYQAITTKFLPCTNSRESRVKATCDAGSVTLGWDHRLNPEGNHTAAAKALATKLDWSWTRWIGGSMRGAGYCFVCGDVGFTVERKGE